MGFLTGKTVIVTGGGRAVLENGKAGAIGYGIATAYAKEGANIVITGRNVKKLEDAKEELERLYGVKVLPVAADISADADNAAIAAEVASKAAEAFGSIDVLINCAQASASGVSLADHLFRTICNILLHAGMLPISGKEQGQRDQLCIRCRSFRQLRTMCLCSSQRRHSWTFTCSCHRMEQGRYQCKRNLPSGMDFSAGKLPESLS